MSHINVAVVRGSFANPYELQNFEPLPRKYRVVVFGSRSSQIFPVGLPIIKLGSLYDCAKYRVVRGLLNRIIVDSHYLIGLEERLTGFDIAHCAETYFHYTQQCLNAKRQGRVKKVVVTVWENIPFNNEGIRGRREFKMRAFKEADLFLPVTTQARNALIKEGCPKNKIIVLMPGIDLKRFKPHKKTGRTVLYVGRFVPEKGIDYLPINPKGYELKVVGGSKAVPYSQIPEVYQSADVFVLPSIETTTWKEQYGMVLLEAMASGLPVVSTGTGAIREVVGDSGVYARPEDIADRVKELVINDREKERLGIRLRKRAEVYFDRDIFAQRLERLYMEVLKK